MRVLICDDDAVLRQVISGLAVSTGHEVVAESDNARGALELVQRLAPDIVILDLALSYGTGAEVLDEFKRHKLATRVLVFERPFATHPGELLDLGAAAVVEKPDFDGLESVLRAWAELPPDGRKAERRLDRVPRRMPESIARSPGGLEPEREFYAALGAAVGGDSLLVLWIKSHGLLVSRDGAHVAADWLMELARVTRTTIRAQDRMACLDGRHLHVLLVGGGADGPKRVHERVQAVWEQLAHEPIGWSSAVHADDLSIEQLLHDAAPAYGGH